MCQFWTFLFYFIFKKKTCLFIYHFQLQFFFFLIKSYLCNPYWEFDKTLSVQHILIALRPHLIRRLNPLRFVSRSLFKINLLLSDWVLTSLCNFVQSEVLDILLYISVNKMWRNNSTPLNNHSMLLLLLILLTSAIPNHRPWCWCRTVVIWGKRYQYVGDAAVQRLVSDDASQQKGRFLLHVSASVLRFFPQFKTMHVRLTGAFKMYPRVIVRMVQAPADPRDPKFINKQIQ